MENIKLTIVSGLIAAGLMLPASPSMADKGHNKQDKGKPGWHYGPEKDRHGSAKGFSKVGIPPGHMPRAGECRIWYPGKAPGHQPRPGNCHTLSRQVPRGAWLIGHDNKWSYDDIRHSRRRPNFQYGKHDRRDDHRDRRVHDGRDRVVREGIRDVREARSDVKENREQLQKNIAELKKDKAELRQDIREGASRKEIRQGKQEIRQDLRKIAENKKELRQSQRELQTAREDLRKDLRAR